MHSSIMEPIVPLLEPFMHAQRQLEAARCVDTSLVIPLMLKPRDTPSRTLVLTLFQEHLNISWW